MTVKIDGIDRQIRGGSGPIFLSDLDCTDDATLLDCNSSPLGRPDTLCSHDSDVVVICEGAVVATYPTSLHFLCSSDSVLS